MKPEDRVLEYRHGYGGSAAAGNYSRGVVESGASGYGSQGRATCQYDFSSNFYSCERGKNKHNSGSSKFIYQGLGISRS